MEPLVLIGAGGHAKVIIDIFEEAREFEIVGCTGAGGAGGWVLEIPVLGDDGILPELYSRGVKNAFVAVGDNRVRSQLTQSVSRAGFRIVNAVSGRAAVSRRAVLGCGVAVMPGAAINVKAEIGDGAIVNTGATIDHDCRIGSFAHVAPGSNLAGGVSVGEGAMLGVGCRVIPGISIGAWSTVGAGAVVIRNLPASVTAVGVPAVVIKESGTS